MGKLLLLEAHLNIPGLPITQQYQQPKEVEIWHIFFVLKMQQFLLKVIHQN